MLSYNQNLTYKHIKLHLKKFAIKILADLFKVPGFLKKIGLPVIKPAVFVLKISGKILFKIIVPVYDVYLGLKRIFLKFYSPLLSKHKIIHPFSRRYLFHLSVIIISIFVTSANLNAYEVRREDVGYTSVLANLATSEELGTIEEEGPITETKKVTRYMGQTGVESQPHLEEIVIEQGLTPGIVTGGSAVVKPILSPAEQELRKRDKIVDYIVQEGDTISEIAQKFGVTSNTLLWENNLTAYTIIRPGQKLKILPVSGIRHKVKRGDTIAKIAKKYRAEVDDIIEFNKLASADDINVGETLIIPGGKKPQIVRSYSLRRWTAPTTSTVGKGKMVWPSTCRRITQYYHWRHHAIDIACRYGTAIKAAAAGRVIKAQGGWNGGYGIMVVIDHGNGIQTLYSHLSKLYVRVGDYVQAGQAIGAEGSSGRSTGPHVHFEVRVSGWRRNPLLYIR
jgi:LysM repeat protein